MTRRPTSFVYLIFSMIVGFYNIYLGRPWYFLFCVPFVVSLLFPTKSRNVFDLISTSIITIVSFFVCGKEVAIAFGIVLYIQSLTVFKTNKYIYGICFSSVIILSCIHELSEYMNKPIDVLMFVAFFWCAFIAVCQYIEEIKEKASGKDQIMKCFELVDEALDVAKKSIEELKNSEGQNARRN